MSLPATWNRICRAPNVRTALFAHFRPVLGTTKANAELLGKICKKARAVQVDTSHEDSFFHSLAIDFDKDRLTCSRPHGHKRDKPLPKQAPFSLRAILGLHSRWQLRNAQVDLFYEDSVIDEGWLGGSDLDGREDVFCPLRVAADMYIYHPDKKDQKGENVLCFLDHEMVDENGLVPVRGDLATVFLPHLARSLNV